MIDVSSSSRPVADAARPRVVTVAALLLLLELMPAVLGLVWASVEFLGSDLGQGLGALVVVYVGFAVAVAATGIGATVALCRGSRRGHELTVFGAGLLAALPLADFPELLLVFWPVALYNVGVLVLLTRPEAWDWTAPRAG